MLLLVTDTSGKNGCVALVRAGDGTGENEVEVIEEAPLTGGAFSAELVPQIAALLAGHGFGKKDIEAFVVVSGPGSFTGLRVGLAAIKALAEILEKPIAAVSLLEVVAVGSGRSGRVLAALDAGRGEVYAGEYEVTGDTRLVRERLLTRDEFLSAAEGEVVATPDETLAEIARERGRSVCRVRPSAEAVARLGWRKLRAGEIAKAGELDANYIRRSDAEIFVKSRT
jgi:tRNA threonylcarbamoyladenosine biosynthesis protein TsaB